MYVFEDNEAVIKMIIKEEVPQWDMFPGPTELRLIGYSIESIRTQNPNQVLCRHANQGKFHTWRMESSFVFVQH